MQRPDIFQYKDYRRYLSDVFAIMKVKNPNWSYEAFAKRLCLKSNASIIKIIHGQRHAGPKVIASMINYFKFDKKQSEYFKYLVVAAKNALPIEDSDALSHCHQEVADIDIEIKIAKDNTIEFCEMLRTRIAEAFILSGNLESKILLKINGKICKL